MRLLVLLAACSSSSVASTPKRHVELPPPPISVATQTIDEEVELRVIHAFPGVDFLKSDNNAIHGHGGPPASINNVVLQFDVRDRRSHVIEVKHVDFLRRGCNEAQWRERKAMKITQHDLYAKAYVTSGDASVMIPAGAPQRYFVRVAFPGVEAYQACDVFSFDVDLIVDRVRAKFLVPLFVTREDVDEE